MSNFLFSIGASRRSSAAFATTAPWQKEGPVCMHAGEVYHRAVAPAHFRQDPDSAPPLPPAFQQEEPALSA